MPNQKQTTDKTLPRGFQSRRTALEILLRINESGAYSNLALSQALKDGQLSKRDRAFVTLLVQGVTRNLTFIDDLISQFSKNPIKKLPAVLRNTLRLAIFQLEFLKDTPPSAVLNTSIALAKACGHKGMGSYTSAVLHSYLRKRGDGNTADGQVSPEPNDRPVAGKSVDSGSDVATYALRFSLPEWLVARWINNFGLEEAQALMSFSASEPRIVLRTNELGITVEGLSMIMKDAGIEFEQSPLVPSCLVLESRRRGRGAPTDLPGYNEGLFSIQDDTAAFVARVLDPKPGEVVIDLCAAPGGKALFLGEIMENRGRVIAVDTRANRLELLKSNRRRLGITNIEIIEADGTTLEFQPLADRILIDAPCSGTGVLNRRADLRHRRKPEDIASLAALQFDLLANAQRLIKPGGVLVYSTCTVEPEENQEVIQKFVSAFPNFKFDDLNPFFPKDLIEAHSLSEKLGTGQIQILPSMSSLSGFYIARLIKSE